MMSKIGDWMRVLREQLHIAPMEAKIIAIEKALNNLDINLNNLDINIATGQALLTNDQKRLEVTLSEFGNTASRLILAIEDERRNRKDTSIQLVTEIAAMKNELKRVADIVEQQIQSTHQSRP